MTHNENGGMQVGLAQLRRLTHVPISMPPSFVALSFSVKKVDEVDIVCCRYIGAGSAGVCLS
jgi:hypothetical protein